MRHRLRYEPLVFRDPLLLCGTLYVLLYFDASGFLRGEPIAMALKNAGVMVHRYTRKEHKPRGIFCAIGRCTDCVMVVNGQTNVRTCITPLEEGMEIRTQYGASCCPAAAAW